MNKTNYILLISVISLVLFLFPLVDAAVSKVMVVNFNYDHGNITLVDSVVKFGYYPDRRYQPDYGYWLEILSDDGSVIDDFRFKAPNEVFVDATGEDGEMTGGKIVMDNMDFALTLPYSENLGEIVIYSSEDKEVGRFDVSEDVKGVFSFPFVIGIIMIAVLLILFVLFRKRK